MLATVNDGIGRDNDIFRAISPIFYPIAEKLAKKQYVTEEFASELRTQFGLSIPSDVLDEFAEPLASAGLLTRSRTGASILYFWSEPNTTDPPGVEGGARLSDELDSLVANFIAFCNKQNDLFFHNWDKDRAADALFDYLAESDVDIARASHILTGRDREISSNEAYICARYIETISKDSPASFDFISGISSALLISEVVIELSSKQKSESKPTDLNIYIDVPVLISLLELAGKERAAFARDLVTALVDRKAALRVFRHSVEEMISVLRAVADNKSGQRKGPTATAIIKGETTEQILRAVIQNPEEFIEKLGIKIDDTVLDKLPNNLRAYLGSMDYEDLYSRMRAVHPDNNAAREYDAKSLALITAKRQGVTSGNIFKSKNILLTDNRAVEAVGRRFAKDVKGVASRLVGPAVSLSRLAAAIWIDGGLSKGIAISRSQLLATCAKTTAIDPSLVERIRKNIRKINPENADKYMAMLSQPRYLQMANDKAVGGTREITEEFTAELFDEITAEIIAPQKAAHVREVNRLKREQQSALRESDKRVQAALSEKEDLQTELRRSMSARLDRARVRGERLGKALRLPVVCVALVIAAVVGFSPLIDENSTIFGVRTSYVVSVIILVVTLASIFAVGIDLKRFVDFFGRRFVRTEFRQIVLDHGREADTIEYVWNSRDGRYEIVDGNGGEKTDLLR